MSEPTLRLYVSSNSPSSKRAQENLRRLRRYCPEAWHVEVVDVLLRPDLAEQAGVLATPTLCFDYPSSPRRIIGDLGDVHKVLEFLGIESERREDDDAR